MRFTNRSRTPAVHVLSSSNTFYRRITSMNESTNAPTELQSSHARLTRRGFLATLAVGSAAAALPNFAHAQGATPEAAATPVTGGTLIATDLPTTWDQEADVVVVGSGAAAFATPATPTGFPTTL
jgi:hypothetical protein